MSVSLNFFIYIGTVALLSRVSNTNISTPLPESQDQELDFYGSRIVSQNNSSLYKFLVRIVYARKVYNFGILFRPRFVLAPYTKLYYYDEVNVYISAWDDRHFEDTKVIRKIVNAHTYLNRLPLCDFQLSILEIQSPFEGSENYWQANFMTERKPETGTPCKILYFKLNKLHEVETKVVDWKKKKCEDYLGYLSNCERDTFVCFSIDSPVEVDVFGSLVLCNNKIAASIPGYLIHEVIPVEYLPYYSDWFLENSDNLMSSCNDITLSLFISIVILISLIAK